MDKHQQLKQPESVDCSPGNIWLKPLKLIWQSIRNFYAIISPLWEKPARFAVEETSIKENEGEFTYNDSVHHPDTKSHPWLWCRHSCPIPREKQLPPLPFPDHATRSVSKAHISAMLLKQGYENQKPLFFIRFFHIFRGFLENHIPVTYSGMHQTRTTDMNTSKKRWTAKHISALTLSMTPNSLARLASI